MLVAVIMLPMPLALNAPWTRLSEMEPRDTPPVDAIFAEMMEPARVAERLLSMLSAQSEFSISPVSFEEHGKQMATRALRAGWSDEWIVGALLHDCGEHLIPNGHGEIPAAILRPYVSPELHWALAHHEIFQFAHYGHAWGATEPSAPRERFARHDFFNATVAFCELDEASFDPRYPSLALDAFRSMVRRVVSRPPYWWASDMRWAASAGLDDTVAAKMQLQAAYPGAATLHRHESPPEAVEWAAQGFSPTRVDASTLLGQDPQPGARAALEAYHRDGIVIIDGLPTTDEESWVNATRRAFLSLVPTHLRESVHEEAYWHRGDATVPSFNDYTNEGRQATIIEDEAARGDAHSGGGSSAGDEHPGWYGGALKLHQDGCYLEEPPRLKLYAPWGAPAVSSFADGRRAIQALDAEHVIALRESVVRVTYEGKHGAAQPILWPGSGMCWNPGDACEVSRNESDAAGTAAVDALAEELEKVDLRVMAASGTAFVVDNSRVLHGRLGEVSGRRRVVGGEAPASAVQARWAEVATVS